MEKIRKRLLYAGLDKETNAKYKDIVLTHDVINLNYYLMLAVALYACLGVAGAVSSGFAQRNTVLYFVTAVIFGIILIFSKLTVNRRGKESGINRVYIFMFMAVLYAEAIGLTLMHPNQPAVTYIGVLLILPLLFAQYPIPMIVFQGCFVLLFCIFASYYKYPEIAAIDVWNGISFFAVSIIEILVVTPMRFNQIIQPEIIRELSETDMLTSLKNRNSYELYCSEVRRKKVNIACIYGDANGLHELNNKYGHEAGDNMLKSVANVMVKHFGKDNVYRIGGDEFVAFSTEFDDAKIESCMLASKNEISQMGYHLSMGCSGFGSSDEIDALIKKAEVHMYEEKRAYYSSSGNNRRSR